MATSKSAPYANVGFEPGGISPTYREAVKSPLCLARMDRTDPCTTRSTTSLRCCSMAVWCLLVQRVEQLEEVVPLVPPLVRPRRLDGDGLQGQLCRQSAQDRGGEHTPEKLVVGDRPITTLQVAVQTPSRSAATRRKPAACVMAISILIITTAGSLWQRGVLCSISQGRTF